MKALVIGLGSMGKRRINLLKQIYPSIEITGIDSNEGRRRECAEKFGIGISDELEKCCRKKQYDLAFVCTSPLSHAQIIDKCLNFNLNIFTEINVVADQYDELIQKAKEKNCVLFLSSTMLYRKELQYIRREIENQKVNYMYHVGQYLPDWHPWEKISDFFVSNKRTNGCRELFAIEFPWLIRTFGKIKGLHVQKRKMSNLEIDYNDSYILSIAHENGNQGMMMLDVVSRKATRRMEIVGEELHIVWEGTPQTLQALDIRTKEMQQIDTYQQVVKDSRYSANIIENAYADEIKHFINVIAQSETQIYSFEEDKEILNMIDEIEK